VTDAPRVNAVGDLELTDPAAMRALAEPTRLTLFDRVRRGPATAAALAVAVKEPEAAVRAHLTELESVGLVLQDGEEWRAVAKGFVFEIPDDPDGQAAARTLSALMMVAYDDLPRRWVAETEPRLDLDWVRASGLFNARVTLTPEELRSVQGGLERLLEPFLTRRSGAPAAARPVRILSYFLPEAP
jgi:DNA-binding transcriptional ArsR family regulator